MHPEDGSSFPGPGIPPEQLMLRFQERLDPAAMKEIAARFTGPALSAARQILSDGTLAEDAVQETLLRLVRDPHRYDPRRPFAHWFYTVLRNVCRDLLRGQARRAEGLRRIAAHVAPAPRSLGETPMDARGLLDRLPDEERTVLILRIQGDLNFEEIGIVLDISREAAKKRAQRGLRRLRERAGNLVPAGRPAAYRG